MSWVFVTEQKLAAAMIAAVRATDPPVTAVVVGSSELADAVSALGADEVRWVEPAAAVPVEAYAQGLADVAAEAAPRVLISSPEPASRALLGAAAARLGAVVVPGLLDVTEDGADLVVRRAAVGGEVVEALATLGQAAGAGASQPVAGIFGGEDLDAAAVPDGAVGAASPAPVSVPAADLRITGTEAAAAATGLSDAARVVGFGRGLRAKDDVALIERLAAVLDAEIGCTMPVADDLRWLDKARYIGRSGQHIAPRLYLAVGIGGAPQHMEGVRDARVVAAVNNDPEARVFKASDYGVVGDLYEVVPALIEALRNEGGGA